MPVDVDALVDPELNFLLEVFPSLEITDATLEEARAAILMLAQPLPLPEGVTKTDHRFDAGGREVRVIVYSPPGEAKARPALLHIHGGGHVVGKPDMSEARTAGLCAIHDCVVAAVQYRLAPETRAPGGVEDCYAALGWLHDNAATLGINAARIGIMGESAGGGLAAALALLARDRGGPAISFQVLVYPMLDDRTCLREDKVAVGHWVWTPTANVYGWTSLTGAAPGSEGISPYAAPARAEDLSGLPPAFITLGALDLFLAEDLDYARRLAEAGVPVELHMYPGAFHAFDLAAESRVGRQFGRDLNEALARLL